MWQAVLRSTAYKVVRLWIFIPFDGIKYFKIVSCCYFVLLPLYFLLRVWGCSKTCRKSNSSWHLNLGFSPKWKENELLLLLRYCMQPWVFWHKMDQDIHSLFHHCVLPGNQHPMSLKISLHCLYFHNHSSFTTYFSKLWCKCIYSA